MLRTQRGPLTGVAICSRYRRDSRVPNHFVDRIRSTLLSGKQSWVSKPIDSVDDLLTRTYTAGSHRRMLQLHYPGEWGIHVCTSLRRLEV